MSTAPPRADAVLLRRLRERDRTAWEDLYAEYGPRLRPFAYRLTGNQHDADDLVQETFVRALPRLDRLDPETTDVAPYLFTTLRNLFLKSVERGRRTEPFADVPEPSVPAPIEDDPERSTLLHNQQEDVRLANARLAPRQRLVLALRELEDRSYAEIGTVVGLNENAVAQLISRARESLRTELRLAQVDPSRLPEECRNFLPLLSRHLDGQLAGPQLEETLAHLESCERCQDALVSMREAQRRYRTLLPIFGSGDDQKQKIDAELVSSGYWTRPPSRFPRPHGRRAVVAGIVALLVAGAGGVGAAVVVSGGKPKAVYVVTSVRSSTATTTAAKTTTAAATSTTSSTTTTRPRETTTTTSKATKTVPPIAPAKTEPATTAATTTTATTTTTAADTTAPSVTIVTRPPAKTTSNNASVSFRASEQSVSFSCRRDNGAFARCSSPVSFHGLAQGAHTFAVRARDGSGNTGPAKTVGWTVLPPPDKTPPTATIVSASTPAGNATFEFTSSETNSSFACSLDSGAFVSCTSPRAYSGLASGAHTFAVRATDSAGNTSKAAEHSWVVPPLPDLVISALTETSFTVTNAGSTFAGPFVVNVTLIGPFSFGGLKAGESVTRTWSVCRVGTLTAVADSGGAVTESNEDNNTRSLVSDC